MDRGSQSLEVSIIFVSVAALFILLRCFSRFVIVKRAGGEDYMIIVALILSIVSTINVSIQRNNGLGRHTKDVTPEQGKILLKVLYVNILLYFFALLIIKDSILYQYLRFFNSKSYRIASWTLISIILVAIIAFILAFAFSCSPVQYFWDKSLRGHCINLNAFYFSYSAFNITTDIAIYLLPIPILKSLNLPRKQKISLILVFTLGGFGCVTSILRLQALYVASVSTDPIYDSVSPTTWSNIELNVGIMCTCIPALRPLITAVAPKLLSTTPLGTSSIKYSRRPSCPRKDSIMELSQGTQTQSIIAANDDDTSPAPSAVEPGTIKVRQEWMIDSHNV